MVNEDNVRRMILNHGELAYHFPYVTPQVAADMGGNLAEMHKRKYPLEDICEAAQRYSRDPFRCKLLL